MRQHYSALSLPPHTLSLLSFSLRSFSLNSPLCSLLPALLSAAWPSPPAPLRFLCRRLLLLLLLLAPHPRAASGPQARAPADVRACATLAAAAPLASLLAPATQLLLLVSIRTFALVKRVKLRVWQCSQHTQRAAPADDISASTCSIS